MNINFFKKVFNSVGHAFHGITNCFRQEDNCKIHLVFTVAVLVINFILRINSIEWCLTIFAIGFVWSAELFNSAIERTVDLCTPNFHPLAKISKDMSAGAVLVAALMSAIIGLIIYIPKFFNILQALF